MEGDAVRGRLLVVIAATADGADGGFEYVGGVGDGCLDTEGAALATEL